MTPQELKNSILHLAIQGKLVEQRPEEGTAEVLYRQIQEEKQRLIKEGKFKKEKPLPEITEDEIPFDIPPAWKWVRMGNIGFTNIGLTYSPQNVSAEGTLVLRSSNIQNSKISYDDLIFVNMDIPDNKKCHSGDILICARNGSKRLVGKAAIIDRDGMSFGAFMAVFRSICNRYILHVINSTYFRNLLLGGTGTTTINQITQNMLKNALVPLPPLAEQNRIVAKIERLLPYTDRYEQAWSRLDNFNRRFPEELQKSILQTAIQGKLVPQRTEEGTGDELYAKLCEERASLIRQKKFKEKNYQSLSKDELPFEIPSSWKWVRLGDIISIESGSGLTTAQMIHGPIPVYGGNGITGYHNRGFLHRETIVIGRVGFYCGSVHVTEAESWVTDNAFITTYPQNSIDRDFLVYMLRHMNLGRVNNATAQPVVSGKRIYPLAFPLPPLAEQRRIVAKLEEILPLCERLKK